MGPDNGYGRASIPLKSFMPSSYTRLSSYTGTESEDAQLIGAQASPSPSAKTFNRTSGSRQTRPTVVLEKRFFKGLVSCSWIIHLIAVLFTAGIVQFTFRRLYWFDEDNWESQWMARLKISQDVAMNGLQFVAKIHEIIIVASVSAMTMHFCRRMLVGDGIPFGFLSGAYQVSSAEWLFSKVSFWATMPRPRKGERRGYVSSPRRVLLGLGAACLCIYCNMVGPSSAIAIIPELRWWDVWAPFEGKLVASYITTNNSEIYPSEISELNIPSWCEAVESETSSSLTFCPDRGFGELLEWAKSFAVGVPSSPMDVTQPLSGVRREVTSSTMGLEASANNFSNENLLAVATTPHSSLTELGGMFWSYLEAYEIAGVRKIKRPQISPQEEVWSPLVQVQCKMFQYSHEWMTSPNSPHKPMDIPHFDSRAMRDFTARARNEENFYEKGENGAGRWSLPQMYWNYTRNNDSLRTTKFTWVDVASMFPTKSPSLGSVLELPMDFVEEDGEEFYQGSLVLPCLMDVRWAGVELSLDPAIDRLFRHNMSDLPQVLGGFWDSEIKVREKSLWALSQRNVPISPAWAGLLNKPVDNITTSSGRRIRNSTAVAALIEQFISARDGHQRFEPPLFEEVRNAGNISGVPDSTGRTVATIIAHALVDGLSRIRYTANLGLALEDHGNGTVSWVGLTDIAGGIRQHEVLRNASLVDGYTPFHWKLRKYGYGYGLGRRTTMFGVAILLIHAGAVVFYASYVLCFRLSPYGWSSSAWGSLDGMLLLAIKSQPSDAARYAGTGIMSNDLFRARTRVRARGDDGVELIVGDDLEEEHKLVKGDKYS